MERTLPSSWRWFVAAFAVLTVLCLWPFWRHEFPGLVDYANHLARLHILSGQLPQGWQAFYVPRHDLIPNLALDVLAGHLIAWGVSPNVALRAFAALAFLSIALGVSALSWSVNRRPPWLALLVFPLCFNRYFVWGFLNYIFSIGLGMLLLALWIVVRDAEKKPVRYLGMVAVSLGMLLLLVSHLMGFGVAAIGLGAYEMGRAFKGHAAWGARVGVMLRAGLIMVPGLLFYALCFEHSGSGSFYYGVGLRGKLSGALSPFLTYDLRWAAVCVVGMVCALWWGAGAGLRRASAWPPATWLPVAFLAALFLVLPSAMMGSDFLDKRLFICVAFFALGLVVFRPDAKQVKVLVCLSVLMVSAKVAEVDRAWATHTGAMNEIRRSVALIPVGSRVGSYSFSDNSLMEYPPLRHAVMLAVIDRSAMVQTLFAAPFNKESVAYVAPVGFKRPLDAAGVTPADPVDWARACRDQQFVLVTHMTSMPKMPSCLRLLSKGAHHGLYVVAPSALP